MVTTSKAARAIAAEQFDRLGAAVRYRVVSSDRGASVTARPVPADGAPPDGEAVELPAARAAVDALLASWGDKSRVGVTWDAAGLSVGLIRRVP